MIGFVFTINCFGQEMPKVIPPSPEAASLFKFMDVPVSLYGGTQNTSIPVVEINSGGIKIPITLSYNSRGVQVGEVAPRVGLGWSLNYGGMISRQIRDKPDESNFGYFNSVVNGANMNSTSVLYSDSITLQNRYDALFEPTIYYNGEYNDLYPDKFMMSTNFYSGEFYFDKNNDTIIPQKFNDIKIKHKVENDRISEFEVTDNYGNTYFFGGLPNTGYGFEIEGNEYERTINSYRFPMSSSGFDVTNGNNDPNSFSPSSWLLRKIVTNNNEEIVFLYENETVEFFRRTGDVDQYTEGEVEANPNTGYVSNNTHPVTFNFSRIQTYQKILKEIRFKEGKVKFIPSENTRLDLNNGHTLDRIEYYNVKNELIKKIDLDYTYTTSADNTTNNQNINTSILRGDTFARNRLFLSSISIVNPLNGNEKEQYQFEYDSQVLPSRHSNSIDYWGYYNGKNRGLFINYNNSLPGDAAVDPIKVQAGLLKKIIYPTGGFSEFEYEPNILQNHLPPYDGLEYENYTPNSNEPYDVEIQNPNRLVSPAPHATIGFINPECYNVSMGYYEIPVTITPNVIGKFTTRVDLFGNTFPYYCKLKNTDPSGPSYMINSGIHENLTFAPGTYTFIFDPLNDWVPYCPANDLVCTASHSFLVSIEWDETEYNYNSVIYGPGSRIKKITNFSADSVKEYSKLFSYVNEDNLPNGFLLSSANYRVVKYLVTAGNSGSVGKVYDNFSFNPTIPFGSFSKDNFGYFKVSEYLLDENDNSKGKITYNYSIYADLGKYYKFPKHPISDNEWLTGKELLQTIYKKENGIFKKVKEIENNYLIYGTHPMQQFLFDNNLDNLMPFGPEVDKPLNEGFLTSPYIRNKNKFCYPYSTGINMNHYVYGSTSSLGYRTSFFIGGTLDLSSTKVTEYFDNDTTVENLTTYEYDYNNHYNVAKTTTVNSTGDSLETSYLYATNTNNLDLIAKNMIGIPLITIAKKNGLVLSTQETVYKDWDENDDNNSATFTDVLLAPEIIQTSKGGATLEKRIKFNKYDENGNPLEVQKEDGMKICYIWGYNKTQPVAKIENIAYDAIPPNLISDIQNATTTTSTNSGSPENVVLDYLQALRDSVALANTMITTFTYKPLIGVSTITDPKGQLTRYEYDDFNRLMRVSDAEGNPLTETEYHYRNQN